MFQRFFRNFSSDLFLNLISAQPHQKTAARMIQLMNVLRWWLALVMLIHLCFVFIDKNLDELHDCNLVTLLIKIVQLPNVLGNIQNIRSIFGLMALLCTF